jgi:Leucine-rich repeat (LRR) protein
LAGDAITPRTAKAQFQGFKAKRTNVTGHGITGFPNLYHLYLNDTLIDDIGVQGFIGINRGNMNTLELSNTRITDRALDPISRLGRLSFLNISHTAITDAGIAKLANVPELNHLNLSNTNVTGEGFRNWKSPSRLTSLILDGTAIEDSSVCHLPKISLQVLTLGGLR